MKAANRVALGAGLYFIATPIGTARDITLRALDILASADVLAAEDTRSLRRLMDIHQIAVGERPLIAYHDHNGTAQRPRILEAIAAGKSVAYASEAGTPLIADPGFQLGRAVVAAGAYVTAAPGASAVLTALTVAGLPTDRFFFAGFAPNATGQRKTYIRTLKDVPGTLVFYESPKRIHKMLDDLASELDGARPCAVARELTKKFEEVIRGTVDEVRAQLADRALKGEIVVLVGRSENEDMDETAIEEMLRALMKQSTLKDAVAEVASASGMARRQVYQMALSLDKPE
ncbi:16S rRNA (cytidine(1402)-2'-O)-methyltransferase [Litoreibacter roseus]|uniref:Ribosomal RNA small subunit methyltransferase I n=1 Tax=Litoreibacter roseus TaxID=2601869 RepID=A0A6N6JAV9_9RHOB|nr:16S rRNA (cytidine(1402)-2'-O)-methyltransferase [Litoreibacter roseus]GFE63315.1 ribosomal RNA small subunit methyltransferase I [Litoreibacter roseus]